MIRLPMPRLTITPISAALLATMAFPVLPLFQSALSAQTRTAVVANSAVKAPNMSAPKADTSLHGVWRVSRGVIAPWVPEGDKSWDTKSWVGQTIRFEATRVAGPESLKCSDAHYEATSFPADALFQGGLKEPSKTAAQNLGFMKFPVAGTSLNCEAGLYEFHRADANTEMVAINNVIWTLDRSPGARAVATSPAGVVQRFMESHFAGDMGFDSASFAAKQKWMTPSLIKLTNKYFAKPVPKDEVPDIDGDPFTNSQEYPTRFSVSAAKVTGTTATVRVGLSDAFVTRNVVYEMRLDAGVWRVDDVKYDEGPTFRALLSGK